MNKVIEHIQLIRAISKHTFLAAVKEKLMYGFLLFSIVFVITAHLPFVIQMPAPYQDMSREALSLNMGCVSINIFLLLSSIFISLTILQYMFSDEHLNTLLTKPIQRWHIIEGVAFGLFKVLFLNWVIMVFVLWMIVYVHVPEPPMYIWVGMSFSLLLSLLYVSLQLFFYTLIPNAMSGILSFFVIVAGASGALATKYFDSLPPIFAHYARLSMEIVPRVADLFLIQIKQLGIIAGISEKLGAIELPFSVPSVFVHTCIVIGVCHLVSCIKFSRPK